MFLLAVTWTETVVAVAGAVAAVAGAVAAVAEARRATRRDADEPEEWT